MIKIGVTQIKNSIEIDSNFSSIMKALEVFKETEVDLVLFPECSLSGFSAKIKDCTFDFLNSYLEEIDKWSKENNKYVVLPTALVDEKIYNTGFIFGDNKPEQFFKSGLTQSERSFFSAPEISTKKVFNIRDYRVAILLCFEAEMEPNRFFDQNEVDLILWPGYWGWVEGDKWAELKKDGEPNLIFKNMKEWKRPLIQSNFAFNDLGDHRESGPHGLSMIIDYDNTLSYQADLDKESCYQVLVEGQRIIECKKVAELS